MFVPQSRVGIFRNECTRSTPLDSKLMCLVRFVLFECIWDPLVALQNSVQNWPKWCKCSCHEVVSEFFATNGPDQPFWTLTSCFGVFRTIWVHLGQFVVLQHSVQNGLNLCKSSCHEVASEFFATYAPDPPHWTLNSCFGVFCTIWVHFVPFGYLTKLSAKRAEVVQNFVPWSRIGIFHKKPLDPPNWTLTSYFVAFHTIWVHLG